MTWTRKPPVPIRLNTAHPAFRSLRYALPFHDHGGTRAVNDAYPNTLGTAGTSQTATLSSGATWAPGRGIAFDASVNAIVDCGSDDGLTGELTILTRAYLTGSTTLSTLCGDNKSDGSERQLSLYYENNKFTTWVNTTNPLNGTATLSSNQWYTYAVVRSGSAGSWTYTSYINGTQDDTATTATDPTTVTNGNWRVGFAGAFTGAPWGGWIDYFFLWLRPLTAAEVWSYSVNPWQLYAPVPRGFARVAAAPGGTVPTPYYYRHLAGGASF